MSQYLWTTIVLFFSWVALGCVTVVSKMSRELVISDHSWVKQCQPLGEFSGGSLWYMVDRDRGTQLAQIQVMENAAKAGATHLVWLEKSSWEGVGERAKAFSCKRNQLEKISYPRPTGEGWNFFTQPNGLQGFCRQLDQQQPASTLCLIVTWGDTSQISNQYKTADDFFSVVKQLKHIDANSGRMKSLGYTSKRGQFKRAECLETIGKSEDLSMKERYNVAFTTYTRGKMCLIPDDKKAWADFSLSARVREGTNWQFSPEDLKLLDDVELGAVK